MYSADAPTTGRVCSIMCNQGSAGGDGIQFDVYGVNYAIGVARLAAPDAKYCELG